MSVVLIILEVIASIALIAVILMQSSKENGLSGALAGNSETFMSKGGRMGMDKMLSVATKWIAAAWVIVTLILCLI